MRKVVLRDRDDLRAPTQLFVKILQFAANRLVVADRVGSVERRGLDKMEDNARALDVSQEVVPQADAFARAFDQTGNIRDDESAVGSDLREPQVRRHRRKGVIGDLGLRLCESTQEGALSGVGEPDEADVGDHSEFEANGARLSLFTWLSDRRRAHRRALKAHISLSAEPSARDDEGVFVLFEVFEKKIVIEVEDHSADGNVDHEIAPILTVTLRGAALLSVLSFPHALICELQQTRDVLVSANNDVSPFTAVAAVGTAARDVFFPSEAGAPVAAFTRDDVDSRFINKHKTLLI